MKNKTIVAFHVGRGGRYYNQGHVKFVGCRPIKSFTNDLFTRYENEQDVIKDLELHDDDSIEALMGMLCNEDLEIIKRKYGIETEAWGELEYYCGASGSSVGLTEKEAEEGIGCIDIDGEYDTTYTKYLTDCNEDEVKLICDDGGWEWNSFIKEELVEAGVDLLFLED